jgi:hypothetical protein
MLEGLTVEQHVSWKKAVDRIKKVLEEKLGVGDQWNRKPAQRRSGKTTQ